MNHSPQSSEPIHPETFDEVIARGFPLGELKILEKLHRERIPQNNANRTASFSLKTVITTAVRNDQAHLSNASKDAFRNAIVKLVEDGKYDELIRDHMDMSHNMHGTMGEVGLYRFLPWHRRYLTEMERELQRVDAILRPNATDKLGIPYWRWQDSFPSWLDGFLPAKDPNSKKIPPSRKNSPPPDKANAVDIDIIVNHYSLQKTGLTSENDYTKFTYGIEGWGKRPDGTSLPAHNQGHAWIGGIMNNTFTSPTDPMFWLHHAEIDRLWEIWRIAHPTPKPPLSGSDNIMDPWMESYEDLLAISSLGYSYDSMVL